MGGNRFSATLNEKRGQHGEENVAKCLGFCSSKRYCKKNEKENNGKKKSKHKRKRILHDEQWEEEIEPLKLFFKF